MEIRTSTKTAVGKNFDAIGEKILMVNKTNAMNIFIVVECVIWCPFWKEIILKHKCTRSCFQWFDSEKNVLKLNNRDKIMIKECYLMHSIKKGKFMPKMEISKWQLKQ
jgi:hypothetical protein